MIITNKVTGKRYDLVKTNNVPKYVIHIQPTHIRINKEVFDLYRRGHSSFIQLGDEWYRANRAIDETQGAFEITSAGRCYRALIQTTHGIPAQTPSRPRQIQVIKRGESNA